MENQVETSELVRRAVARDEDALRALFERFQRTVIVTAWSIVGDYHLAQDVAQDCFVVTFRNLEQLKDPSAFGGWLLTTTRRLAVRRSRQVKSHHATSLSDGGAIESHASTEGFKDDSDTHFMHLLITLPDHEREVVCLRYLEDYSVTEIAQELSRPVGTVTKQLSRAVDRLRKSASRVNS